MYDPSTIITDNKLSCEVFDLNNNNLESVCTEPSFSTSMALVKKFVAHVYKRESIIKRLKEIILFPLIDCLKKILLYHLYETNPTSNEIGNLKQCPPTEQLFKNYEFIKTLTGVHRGLFLSLKELLRTFKIFSFNGARYDNPLIFPFIMGLVCENNTRPQTPKHLGVPCTFNRIRVTKKGCSLYLYLYLFPDSQS